VTCYNNHC